MSTFGEISRPLTAFSRNARGGESPRVGIVESLEAPGLEPLPPVSGSASSIAQAMVALDMAGSTADALTRLNLRAQAQIESERAAREEENRRAEQFDRGQAAEDAEARAPILAQEIDEGKIIVPDGEALDGYFTEFVDGRTEGHSDAYRAEYRRRVVPDLVRAQIRKNTKVQEEQREIAAADAVRPAAGTTDPNEFARAEKALTETLGFSSREARARVGLSAMQAAALDGNRPAFEAAGGYLDGLDPIQQAKFAITLEERESQNRRESVRAVNDRIAALYNARNRGEPITFDFINREIERLKPRIGENEAERLFQESASREHAEQAITLRDIVRAERNQIRSEAVQAGVEATLNARAGVAGNAAIPRIDASLSDGSNFKIAQDEMRRMVIEGAVETIRDRHQDPAESFARTIEYLDLNGFTLPEWEEALAVGQRAGLSNFVTQEPGRKPGTPVEIPQTTTAAIELWRRLPQSTRAAHTSPETALFYDLVEAAVDGPASGDINRAIAMIVSVQQGALSGSGTLPTVDLDTVRKNAAWTTKASNGANLQARIRRTAQLYVASAGMDPEKAVKRASEELEERSIEVGPARLPLDTKFYSGAPRNLPDISSRVVRAYLSANPDEPVRDPERLSLLPIPGTSLFAVHTDAGPIQAPVEGYEKAPAAMWDLSELLVLESVLAANPDAPIVRYSPEAADRFLSKSASQATEGLSRAHQAARTRHAAALARTPERTKIRARISELESRMATEKDPKKVDQMIGEINTLTDALRGSGG